MLLVFRKVVNWIFFFFFAFSFLWLDLYVLKYCTCFEKLNLLKKYGPGFLLKNKKYKIYLLYKIIYLILKKNFSRETVSYKRIVLTHSYLMVCVQTLKDASWEIKIWDAMVLMLWYQRRSVQAEILWSLYRQLGEPSE